MTMMMLDHDGEEDDGEEDDGEEKNDDSGHNDGEMMTATVQMMM